MSNSISTLVLRNLSYVFEENDPARRRDTLDGLWNHFVDNLPLAGLHPATPSH